MTSPPPAEPDDGTISHSQESENVIAEDARLAAFQAAMLELFAADLPPAEVMRRLGEDEAFERYRDWIQTFEPRMVETAAALVRKWAKRRGAGAVGEAIGPPPLERG